MARLQSHDCSLAISATPNTPISFQLQLQTAVVRLQSSHPDSKSSDFFPISTPNCSRTTAVQPFQFFLHFNSKLQSRNCSLATPETPNTPIFSQLQTAAVRLQSSHPDSESSNSFPISTPNCSRTTAVWLFRRLRFFPSFKLQSCDCSPAVPTPIFSPFQLQTAVARLQSGCSNSESSELFPNFKSKLQSHDCSPAVPTPIFSPFQLQTAVARLQSGQFEKNSPKKTQVSIRQPDIGGLYSIFAQ